MFCFCINKNEVQNQQNSLFVDSGHQLLIDFIDTTAECEKKSAIDLFCTTIIVHLWLLVVFNL